MFRRCILTRGKAGGRHRSKIPSVPASLLYLVGPYEELRVQLLVKFAFRGVQRSALREWAVLVTFLRVCTSLFTTFLSFLFRDTMTMARAEEVGYVFFYALGEPSVFLLLSLSRPLHPQPSPSTANLRVSAVSAFAFSLPPRFTQGRPVQLHARQAGASLGHVLPGQGETSLG